MNSYHDNCIGCHRERAKAGKKAGAVTCGECHIVREKYKKIEHAPIGSDYYLPLEDTYHRDCIGCHKEEKKLTKKAEVLNWKGFYV
ncbi:MAG TPA: hypothetical protein DHT43_06265, partial [Deltaproteobacteria bacterium]|nr:hypothetical protein [Deltaproteobacteria bacterium]